MSGDGIVFLHTTHATPAYADAVVSMGRAGPPKTLSLRLASGQITRQPFR